MLEVYKPFGYGQVTRLYAIHIIRSFYIFSNFVVPAPIYNDTSGHHSLRLVLPTLTCNDLLDWTSQLRPSYDNCKTVRSLAN